MLIVKDGEVLFACGNKNGARLTTYTLKSLVINNRLYIPDSAEWRVCVDDILNRAHQITDTRPMHLLSECYRIMSHSISLDGTLRVQIVFQDPPVNGTDLTMEYIVGNIQDIIYVNHAADRSTVQAAALADVDVIHGALEYFRYIASVTPFTTRGSTFKLLTLLDIQSIIEATIDPSIELDYSKFSVKNLMSPGQVEVLSLDDLPVIGSRPPRVTSDVDIKAPNVTPVDPEFLDRSHRRTTRYQLYGARTAWDL